MDNAVNDRILNNLLIYMERERENKLIMLNKIKELIREYQKDQKDKTFSEIQKLSDVFIRIYGEHDLNKNGIMIF
jgi:F0F1-type ATP synthase alpha subunit